MTPKQSTEAGSLTVNPVTVETLESRMCLSAAVTPAITPMLQYALARAEARELAHFEFHAEQTFAYHAATSEGYRADYHDHDVRPDMGGGEFATPVGGFIANFGGRTIRMIIIQIGGDAQLPANPPSYSSGGGAQVGDTSSGPTINPTYGGANPVTDPVTSPPPVSQPVVVKPIDVTPPTLDPSSAPVQQQQHKRATPAAELPSSTTTNSNQSPLLVLDSRSLKPNGPVVATARLADAVLSNEAAAENTFTAKFASALKSLTPANFADLSVARLAGAGESTFLHSLAGVPMQADAKVEGVLADAVAGATARPRFFEFTHLGSPFALLSDSMANFVEDSASLPMAVAKGQKAGSWTLTGTVIAADVILLTYMYRRSQRNRRRYQFAQGYEYHPFAG